MVSQTNEAALESHIENALVKDGYRVGDTFLPKMPPKGFLRSKLEKRILKEILGDH